MTRTCGVFHHSFVTEICLTNTWNIELCTFLFQSSPSLSTTMIFRYPTHTLLWFLLVSNSLDLTIDIFLQVWSAVVGKVVAFSVRYTCLTYHLATQDSYLHMLSRKFYLLSLPMLRKPGTEPITGLLLFSLLIFHLLKSIFFEAGIPEGATNVLEDNSFALCIISH